MNEPQHDSSCSDPDPRAFRSVHAFVTEFISVNYARQISDQHGRTWCPQWWRHCEAYVRFDALWRAYEYLRRDPTSGLSRWWLHHADPHMERLFDPQGAFRYCSVRSGHKSMLSALTVADRARPTWRDIATANFDSIDDFVNIWLSAAYSRQVSDVHSTVWCPQWRKHPEAVSRMTAMWQAFEDLRRHATGLSQWWVCHADPHMERLFDPQGPFRYCSVRHGHRDMLGLLPMESPSQQMYVEPTTEELLRYMAQRRE